MELATMQDVMVDSVRTQRFTMFVLAAFAILALALAAVGIYGVMSYVVAQRTHEIGIRIALGARLGNIFELVMGNALWLALAGIALGSVGAFALTRLMKSLCVWRSVWWRSWRRSCPRERPQRWIHSWLCEMNKQQIYTDKHGLSVSSV